MSSATILVVEDEGICGLAIQETLERAGHRVPAVIDSGNEVLGAVLAHKPDLVVMDVKLRSYIDGIDAAARLRMVSRAPVIYLTAYPEKGVEARALRTEPAAYLAKPLDEKRLVEEVEKALARGSSPGAAFPVDLADFPSC